jgi:hypothetical protein
MEKRMRQRGYTKSLTNFVIEHGKPVEGGFIMNRKIAQELLVQSEQVKKLAQEALKKGEIFIAAEGETLKTVYSRY